MSLLLLLPASGGAPSPLTGEAAITESADTIATAGVIAVRAAGSLSEIGDSLASGGAVSLVSHGTVAEVADALMAEAVLLASGTCEATSAGDTLEAGTSLALAGDYDGWEADDTAEGYSGTESHPAYKTGTMDAGPFLRYRKSRKRWTDPQGRQWELYEDTEGNRHLREIEAISKPYKPVHGIRIARRPVTA